MYIQMYYYLLNYLCLTNLYYYEEIFVRFIDRADGVTRYGR